MKRRKYFDYATQGNIILLLLYLTTEEFRDFVDDEGYEIKSLGAKR